MFFYSPCVVLCFLIAKFRFGNKNNNIEMPAYNNDKKKKETNKNSLIFIAAIIIMVRAINAAINICSLVLVYVYRVIFNSEQSEDFSWFHYGVLIF